MDTHYTRFNQCRFHFKGKLHNFRYSLTKLSIGFLILLLAVSLAIISSISLYYHNELKAQYYDNTMNILRFYNNKISSQLSTLDTYLFQLGIYNTDISTINTTSDNLKFYNSKMKLYLTLSNNLNTFENIDGMFCYAPLADDYLSATNKSSTLDCSSYIQNFLKENKDNIYHLDGAYQGWLPHQDDDRTYLVRFIISGGTVLGAWSSLETLTQDFDEVFANDSVICYADEDYKILDNPQFADFTPQTDTRSPYQIYRQKDTDKRYLVAAESLSYSPCHIVAFIPLTEISHFMLPVYQRLLGISFIIIVSILVISVLLKRMVDIPFAALQDTLKSIQQGDENAVISAPKIHCIEIVSLIEILNSMLQKIKDLKIDIYEERILKTKIEFQLLRTQVSPHFITNCLQTFSSLATAPDPEGENRYTLQKLMQTLSDHLRYSLSTRSCVTLKEELDYNDNYLQMISMRYPECLTWRIDAGADTQDAIVSPMLLLMLTENSIKHNMIMGEKLQLYIKTHREIRNGIPSVHIIHIDSGNGFDEEMLEKFNTILEHPEARDQGHCIGIYNIVKSLELTYHDDAQILFSNEPDKGARIDLFIPYQADYEGRSSIDEHSDCR